MVRSLRFWKCFTRTVRFYCNAVTPQGEWKRIGAGSTWEGTRDWAERVAGLKPDIDLHGRHDQLKKRSD